MSLTRFSSSAEGVHPSLVLARVLNDLSSLNLSGQVVVDSFASLSDRGGYGDVYKTIYTPPQTGKPICVALKRLRIHIGASDGELAKVCQLVPISLSIADHFFIYIT